MKGYKVCSSLCKCPGAAVTNDYIPHGLKPQKPILLQLWIPESEIQVGQGS